MDPRKNSFPTTKKILATSTVAGMAAVMAAVGLPATTGTTFAEPVQLEAPQQVPGFADVVEAVSPAVVSVRVQNGVEVSSNSRGGGFDSLPPGLEDLPDDHPMKRFFREFGEREFGDRGERRPMPRGARPVSQGSGFFISEDGYLVTNNHVVSGGESYSVILDDGTELDAELIGTDSRTDLAVLKVENERDFTYVEFGDDSQTRIGDWVVAVGNPFGLGGTVTAGIVSARGREIGAGPYDDFIQVDAAVNRGNSGGPTFNLSGNVIGVNTAIFSPSGGNVGIAFAIPANLARDVVDQLIEDGTVERGWLGVQIQPVTDDIAESLGLETASGALVTAPQPDTPAARAGVEAGDVVTAVDGEGVEDPRDLARRIGGLAPGESVELTLWRNGASEMLSVELGSLPVEEQAAITPEVSPAPQNDSELTDFGMTVVPAEQGGGLVITNVDPEGPAAERGFQVGDVIVRVQDQEVATAEDVTNAVQTAADSGRRAALFQLRNEDDQNRFVALPIERG